MLSVGIVFEVSFVYDTMPVSGILENVTIPITKLSKKRLAPNSGTGMNEKVTCRLQRNNKFFVINLIFNTHKHFCGLKVLFVDCICIDDQIIV